MIQVYDDPYDTCFECHERKRVFAILGMWDKAGHYDQENGGCFCADCLRNALRAIDAYRPPEDEDVSEETAP